MAVALAAMAVAEAALPRAGGHLTGHVTVAPGVTIDGRDVSLDGQDLDAVQAVVDSIEQDDD